VKNAPFKTAVLLALAASAVAQSIAPPPVPNKRPHAEAEKFVSPDKRLVAIVVPADKHEGYEELESRVEIHSRGGAPLCAHDFSSDDGEHGYGVDGAQWTPNSQFFVFRLRSSGGHSPMNAPVVFWSRKTNRFYDLKGYTADVTFSVTAPDNVSVDTWTDLRPATLSLHSLQEHQRTELP